MKKISTDPFSLIALKLGRTSMIAMMHNTKKAPPKAAHSSDA